MLRILLWKLGFEWANLMRIVFPRHDERVYYFAFGANLSLDVLKRRRIEVFDAVDFALEDAALRFTQSGFFQDQGFASADEAFGEVVYGKLYAIRRSDARRMDFYEGVPFMNAHHKVWQSQQGFKFYYYRAITRTENLKPTREYLDYITNAYHEMPMVPETYIETLESLEVLEHFEPQTLTGKFVHHIERWPAFLHPLLVRYEALCRKTVFRVWNWSILKWMIRY